MKKDLESGLLLAISLFVASCATEPVSHSEKRCSDTPRGALVTLLGGIRDALLTPILSVLPEGLSYRHILVDKNSRSGNDVIREILKSPVVGGGVNCNCDVVRMTPTDDPQAEEALIERTDVDDDDKLHHSRRVFRVFFTGGNCIHHIVPVTDEWVAV